jgi:hypothetical protein
VHMISTGLYRVKIADPTAPKLSISSLTFYFSEQNVVYRITELLDLLHRPVLLGIETRRLGNWICFRPQVKGGGGEKTPTRLGPLERANLDFVCISHSPKRATILLNIMDITILGEECNPNS